MSGKRLYAIRNDDRLPCHECGEVLPYWTHHEGAHHAGAVHPIITIDDLADTLPSMGKPVPLDEVPPEYRRETWDLSAEMHRPWTEPES